jgi:hypothetical protein
MLSKSIGYHVLVLTVAGVYGQVWVGMCGVQCV